MGAVQANAETAAWRVVDGEAVIVHADTSAYYGLNATGTYIWEEIANRPLSLESLAARVSARYHLAPDLARSDVEAFLASLREEGLLLEHSEAVDHPVGGDATSAGGAADAYEPPRLVRFGELEQLVLSGE